jgi:REP element-mobilizing transposase RayT
MAGRTNRKEAPRQLELAPMMKRPRRRRGPGRPRGRTKVAHARRPEFVARHPLHVTLRCAQGDVSLRRYHPLEVVRGAIRAGGHREDFRVVEFHLLSNHLHLIVEAAGAVALARGMQGLAVRLARGINRALGRSGKLFVERYHARCLRSPREVRATLRYVLLNAHHHAAERGERRSWWADPCSSGAWFDGWRHRLCPREPWQRELLAKPRPTAAATVWLLTTGWRRWGPLWFDDLPGAAGPRRPARDR